MIRNPFKQGRKISGRKRLVSGLTAGLLAASSIVGALPATLASAAGDLVDLGTFKYATQKELGSANKYAAFAYTYTQANHMEGIFACNNYHPYGDAFGTTNNVVNYVDSKENHIYIGENIGGGDAELNVIEQVHQTNGINDDMLWDMILPDTITINRTANNGQGVQLEDVNGYQSGVFNSEKDLAKKIYHVSEVTYNIDFVDALTALDEYQEYWAKQDTSDVTEVTLPDKENSDWNNWVIDIECAEGGNVVTLDAQDIKDSRLNIKAKDGVSDYSLIINVTGLNDGDHFDREIKIDDADSLYGPQAGKVLFNMLGEDGDQYYFTKLNQGVILAPTQEVYIYQTHNGSVMGFYVENNGCEIHQNGFRQLAVKDHNNIEISKMAVGGQKELPGARLSVTAASGNNDVDWNKVIAANDGVRPVGGTTSAPTGITWLSGTEPRIIKGLPDGTYYLDESGADADGNVTLDGKKYQVVESSLRFTVKEGQLTDVRSTELSMYGVQIDGSYYTAENVQKTGYDGKLFVCNAVAEDIVSGPADLVINKFDLTGENEIAGAKLTITGTTDAGKAVSMDWTSKENETWNISLDDGVYTLSETGDVIVTDDGVFDVIPSSLNFTVKNGKVTDVKTDNGADISKDGFNKNAYDGYFTVGTNADKAEVINICDAKRTNVKLSKQSTGGDEIPNAKLTLKGVDANGRALSFENVRFADEASVTDGSIAKNVISWTSSRTPVEVVGLPNGSYTFHEVAAPNGYQVTTDITFDVYYGNVTVTSVNGKATSGTVIMTDNRNTTVSINKFDLTGKNEVEGARLTVKGISAGVEDYEYSWVSVKGKAEVLTGLADGDYTLTEEADDESGEIFDMTTGKYYKVIKDTLTFSVRDGSVWNTSSNKAEIYPSTPSSAPAEEYYVAGRNNTISICDAEIKQGDVTINKFDITGQNEVEGAQLTLTGEGIDWARLAEFNPDSQYITDKTGKVTGLQWVSEKGAEWNVTLRDGTGYVLTETAVAKDGETEYEVIPSSISFDIVDGKVANIDNKQTDIAGRANPNATDETTDSYVVANNGVNEIYICDAKKIIVKTTDVTISKTDITGEKEIKGAQLQVTSTDVDWTEIVAANAGLEKVTQNGKVIGLSWTSDDQSPVVLWGLTEGSYTLTETGKPFEYDGDIYEVIDSKIGFTIDADGKVTVISETKPAANAEESDKGYAVGKGDTITICDASRTVITVSKKDITGEKEVIGAHLVIKDASGKIVDQWDSNGKDHIVSALTNGTYKLEETAVDAAVAGGDFKIIDSVVTFTVKNGKITSAVAGKALYNDFNAESEDSYAVVDKATGKITICDAEKVVKTTKVIINKTDITGEEELDGAILTVTDSDGKTVGESWTSKKGEKFEIELEDGTYTLTETGDTVTNEAGEEFEIITSEIKFTVEDGKVTVTTEKLVKDTFDKDSTEGYVVVTNGNEADEITVCDAKKKKTKVIINKTDITGEEELDGAILTVTDSDGKTVGESWTSKKGEKFEIELEDGTYTLTETGDTVTNEAGEEFEIITSEIKFTVEDGKVTVTTEKLVKDTFDKDSTEGYVVVTNGNDSDEITVCDAKKKKTKVIINKTDITGEEELDGAILTVTDSDGKTVGESWTSKKGEKFEIELEDGTYTLTETGDTVTNEAGEEFEIITSEIKFTVEDGKVTVTTEKLVKDDFDSDSTEGYVVVTNGNEAEEITVCDAKKKKTKVIINKTDITGEEELDGAILTVTDSDGKTVGESWTSKKGEKFEIELEDGTYTLTETGDTVTNEAGEEFEIITSEIKFTVEDGKVTVTTEKLVKDTFDKDSTEGYVVVTNGDEADEITVCDAKKKKTKVIINKTDITGEEELDGAILTVTDSDGKTVGESWTSKNGEKFEIELEDGTYTLTETGDTVTNEAGEEFEIITSEIKFTVEDGKVTVTTEKLVKDDFDSDSTEGYVVVTNGNEADEITVCDAKKKKTKVIINKTDITGEEELDGAILTVTDSDGKTVGESWTSKKGEKFEIELEDGTYTLTETGDTVTNEAGEEFEIITSEIKFTVEDGKVTVTTEKLVKDTFDKDSTEGYVVVTNGNEADEITVCDAKKKKTKVIINKTDITGEEELDGAILTVTDSDGKTVGESWTSKKGEKFEIELEDGTYTLTETGDTVTNEAGEEFEIITSEIKFTVEDGKVTVTTEKLVKDDFDKDSTEGYVVVTNGNDADEITVCDAKKKTVVDGDESSKTDVVDDSSSEEQKDNEDSSRPGPDMESSVPEGDTTADSSKADTDESSATDDSASSTSSTSSTSSSASSTSSTSTSSKATTTTSTTTNTSNPNTGARVLVNAAEFAAAVGLCFFAVRRKKNNNDDQ